MRNEENIRAILDTCFSESKDEIKEVALKNIMSLSADAVQGWIPCSERLPRARESVILSTKEWTGEGCHWETTKHHVIWKGYGWNATYWDDEVIAWMPLPPVYQGE